jgi:formate-dependent phosphoribosylglycinamide formyltransferase (GAR transformylase)
VLWSYDDGDELFSPILPSLTADGGDELCSVAAPEVSAVPDCGMVADLDASGDTVFAVGGLVGGDEFSVATAGTTPMASAMVVVARRRVMSFSLRAVSWASRVDRAIGLPIGHIEAVRTEIRP